MQLYLGCSDDELGYLLEEWVPVFIDHMHLSYYQRVGAELLLDLQEHAQAPCGFATLHDVLDKSQEDRMESFFLSETLVSPAGPSLTLAPYADIICV